MNRREFSRALGAAVLGAQLGPDQLEASAMLTGEQPAPTPTPPTSEDLCDLTAIELASRIRRKQVSAREVMQAHLARIERVNPKVNAIVTLVADRAMAAATRADEALARGD